MFEGIDLLDPTKLVPEELAPVQAIGLLTLTANPTNYFAETEQVAFHVGNLVPGIDVTNDPLLQARLFSYVDTQLTRLGGPNFTQLPINRPHAPVNDMLRDGFHQHAVHGGVAPYKPNSLDGGCPFFAGGARDGAFVDVPAVVAESVKTREAPASYDDHFSQARQFWLSMTPPEKEHIVAAYTFELAKCFEQAIKERQLLALANIDPELCAQVAARAGASGARPDRAAGRRRPEPGVVAARPHRLAGRGSRGRDHGRPGRATWQASTQSAGPRRGRHGAPGRRAARREVWRAAPRSSAPSRRRGRSSSTPSSGRVPTPAADALAARDSKAARGRRPGWTRGWCCWSGVLPPRQGDRRLG